MRVCGSQRCARCPPDNSVYDGNAAQAPDASRRGRRRLPLSAAVSSGAEMSRPRRPAKMPAASPHVPARQVACRRRQRQQQMCCRWHVTRLAAVVLRMEAAPCRRERYSRQPAEMPCRLVRQPRERLRQRCRYFEPCFTHEACDTHAIRKGEMSKGERWRAARTARLQR